MADPTTNPDGTKQVSAPTRSAFATPAASKATPAKDGDTESSAGHEQSIIEGIKGLIRHGQSPGTTVNKNERSALDALDSGVSSAPGNSADY